MNRRQPGTRIPLTKQLVVQVAIEIADNDGLEALSMRRLGRELNVEAMALYYHYTNKNELIEDMLNAVHSEIITPDNDVADWREAMRARAESVLDVVSRHSWAATIMESGANPGPATMQDREAMVRCFRQAGFSIEATVHAVTILDIYTYGAAGQYAKLLRATNKDTVAVSNHVAEKFPGTTYPYFSEILAKHLRTGKYNPIDEFYFGLELVLDGIERLHSSHF